MRLSDKPSYLVVQRESVSGQRVRLVEGLHEALPSWHPTTALSPVFRLNTSIQTKVDFAKLDHYELLFVGPLAPFPFLSTLGLDEDDCDLAVWLTLGAHNFVVGGVDLSRARSVISDKIPIEHWVLKQGVVCTAPTSSGPPLLPLEDLKSITVAATELATPKAHVLLRSPALEYCSLMATTLQRASICLPQLVRDLKFANEEILADITEAIKSIDLSEIATDAGAVTNSNLGLARLSSQALSSFAPLIEGEADLKMHSLLGVGVANLALQRIRRFVEKQFGLQDIPGRISLLTRERNPTDLSHIRCSDTFWDRDILGGYNPTSSSLPFPLITYFSDTDHYKSTLTTLSAPTAAIGSCNAFQWSLLTLTHEICHTIVRAILRQLLPSVDDESALTRAIDVLEDPTKAADLLEQSGRLLLTSILAMDCSSQLSGSAHPAYNPRRLADVIRRWHHEVEELLVHLLDFMYFYDSDDQKYVPWIWLSWGVIPNIGNRVPEYIQRTLCVLLSKNLLRGEGAEKAAREQLTASLMKLEAEVPTSHVRRAIEVVNHRWDTELYFSLVARKGLVKLAKGILHSPKLAGPLLSDASAYAPGPEKGGYSATSKMLTDLTINNPLRFLKAFTRDYEPSAATSAWMLTTIAFNSTPDDDG